MYFTDLHVSPVESNPKQFWVINKKFLTDLEKIYK